MEKLSQKDIRTYENALRTRGYVVYDQPYKLNIVGKRKDSTIPNQFDDTIAVFYTNDKGEREGFVAPATTDPGTYYLKNPINKLGTAILKADQYVDTWIVGKHKGLYDALVQNKKVTVLRDYDRNAVLDFLNGKPDIGLFGINIHKAGANSKDVDTWSAGCQVFSKTADFNEFMKLVQKDKTRNGNRFTYTLIDERAFNRAANRAALIAFCSVGVIATVFYFRKQIFTKANLNF